MMNNRDTVWSLPVTAHSENEVPMSAINAATKPINTFAIKYMLEQAVDDEDDGAHRNDIKQVYCGYFAPACVYAPTGLPLTLYMPCEPPYFITSTVSELVRGYPLVV
jgi:hypothetical protein